MKRIALIYLSLLAVLFSCHPMEDEAGEMTPGFISITAILEDGSVLSAWPEDAVLDVIDDKGEVHAFDMESADALDAVFICNAFPMGRTPQGAHLGVSELPMAQVVSRAGTPDDAALSISGKVQKDASGWNVTLVPDFAFLGFAFTENSLVGSISLEGGPVLTPGGEAVESGHFKNALEGQTPLVYYLAVTPGTYPDGLTVTLANKRDDFLDLSTAGDFTLERGSFRLWSETAIEFGVAPEYVDTGDGFAVTGESFSDEETITID